MSKALFVLKIFAFLSWLFGYVEKQLDKKAISNFKIYDATDWTSNNFKSHISYYKSFYKCGGEGPFLKIKIEHVSESTVWNVPKFVFIVGLSRVLPKYIKFKMLNICFYLK